MSLARSWYPIAVRSLSVVDSDAWACAFLVIVVVGRLLGLSRGLAVTTKRQWLRISWWQTKNRDMHAQRQTRAIETHPIVFIHSIDPACMHFDLS